MKKTYISPLAVVLAVETQHLMADSLDPTKDSQSVTPEEEEYNDEFSSRLRNRNVWDDGEEF